jgi:hypothetical protein
LRILLFILVLTSSAWASSELKSTYRLQRDLYIKSNACQQSIPSYLNVLSLEFDVPKQSLNQKWIVGIHEQNSRFNQTIIFNGKTWFYPIWTSGHKEYGLPECEGQSCSVHFFVFLNDQMLKIKDWYFQVNIFNQKDYSKIYNTHVYVDNKFLEDTSKMFFEDLKLEYKSGKAVAKIDKDKVKSLLSSNYKVKFILQSRTSQNQQQYTEKTVVMTPDHPWLKNQELFSINEDLKELTYLGFLIYVTKDNLAFETKIEIMNKNDAFYNCSEKSI